MSKETKKGAAPVPPKLPAGDQRPPSDDPDVARQKALAGKIMDEDREVLRTLAE